MTEEIKEQEEEKRIPILVGADTHRELWDLKIHNWKKFKKLEDVIKDLIKTEKKYKELLETFEMVEEAQLLTEDTNEEKILKEENTDDKTDNL